MASKSVIDLLLSGEKTVSSLKIPNMREGYSLRSYQKIAAAILYSHPRLILYDQMGFGKAQPISEKVLTPSGWASMGSLMRGDLVIGSDGYPKEILEVYPQGLRPIYRITFSDDSEVLCDHHHLWEVFDSSGEKHIKSVKDIVRDFSKDIYKIKLPEPIQFYQGEELPIDPYLLGVILSCGNLRRRLQLSGVPNVVKSYLKENFPNLFIYKKGYCLENVPTSRTKSIFFLLARLRLSGKEKRFFTIPSNYLYANLENRVRLFQGICDCLGDVYKNRIRLKDIPRRFKKSLGALVSSLGGMVSDEGAFSLISLSNKINPFLLKSHTLNSSAVLYKNISKFTYSHQEEAKCIYIDSADHLYVTSGYNLTHNTVQSFSAFSLLKRKNPDLKLIYATVLSGILQAEEELNRFFEGYKTVSVFSDRYYLGDLKKVSFSKKNPRESFWEGLAKSCDCIFMGHNLLKMSAKQIIRSLSPFVLVLDEANFFKGVDVLGAIWKDKSNSSEAFKIARILNKYSEATWLLTADPIENSIKDAYGLMSIIRDDIYGSCKDFANNYCKIRNILRPAPSTWLNYKGPGIEMPTIYDYKNKNIFREKFKIASVGRTRKEVSAELPSLIVKNIFLDLPRNQQKIYDMVSEGFLSGMNSIKDSISPEEIESIALENMIRCQQLLGCPSKVLEMINEKRVSIQDNSNRVSLIKNRVKLLRKMASKEDACLYTESDGEKFIESWENYFLNTKELLNSYGLNTTVKLEEIKRLLFDSLTGQKVIIYSSYKKVIDFLEEKLTGLKPEGSKSDLSIKPLKPLRITGSETGEERELNRRVFLEDPDHNILLVTTAAVKALNLQQASVIICHDVPITWGKLRQLSGRIVRQGSKFSEVLLIMLMVNNTVDRNIYDKLYATQKDVEYILGDLDKDKVVSNLESSLSSKSLLDIFKNK